MEDTYMSNDKEKIFAYLAGFIDADGSLTIVTAKYNRKTKNGLIPCIQYRVKLSAHNCKLQPIELLQKEFGGGKLRNTRRGKVKLHPKWRACYEWIITNTMAANAIQSMLPYLIVKNEQAILCLELDKLKKLHTASARRWNIELNEELNNKFQSLKDQINILNKRGQ